MAQEIEVTVTGLLPGDLETVASEFGWKNIVPDDKGGTKSNPESAREFYERHLEKLTVEILRAAEAETAAKAARKTAETSVDTRVSGKKKEPKEAVKENKISTVPANDKLPKP